MTAPARRRAFSLIEIILAIGIISFAVVAILGMFPVAVRAATDSQHETQAALIARSLLEEIESRPGPTRYITLSDNFGDADQRLPIRVDQNRSLNDVAHYDSDAKHVSRDRAVYSVDVAVVPQNPPSSLSQVTLSVRTRTADYPFTALFRQ